jgi:hypothetical protein
MHEPELNLLGHDSNTTETISNMEDKVKFNQLKSKQLARKLSQFSRNMWKKNLVHPKLVIVNLEKPSSLPEYETKNDRKTNTKIEVKANLKGSS